MQTTFTEQQLQDPGTARAEQVIRKCVHCGFCTATCPTYAVLGDELDSPRGRIYLMKQMLEEGRPADAKTVKHIDRCLSCLACMTTCPSGVHYMHLVDHAREYIEKTYTRPWHDRALRWMLRQILPYPNRFRLAMLGAKIARPVGQYLPGRLGAMMRMARAPIEPPARHDRPQVHAAEGARRGRVALMTGCAQMALDAEINGSTIRLLTRHGFDVVIAKGIGCCGALEHHMGKSEIAHRRAEANIAAWMGEVRGEGLDAVIINTSGCGTTVKDYGHMLRSDPAWAEDAAAVSALAMDVSEFMAKAGLIDPTHAAPMRVAYHAACSLQHGQKVTGAPKSLLRQSGFKVVEPADPHLCCGSAGTYNLLQPEIAEELKKRKVATLEAKAPEVIAAGNIGCMQQIGSGTGIPIVHTAALLDWATGGPVPRALRGRVPEPAPAIAGDAARPADPPAMAAE
ncbi:MAG: glycolate oxidase subunit GlcF [Pseudomonadota bacterium]